MRDFAARIDVHQHLVPPVWGRYLADRGLDSGGAALARSVNEFGAELVKDHPDRVGLFASPGDPDYEQLWAELDRHNAVNLTPAATHAESRSPTGR